VLVLIVLALVAYAAAAGRRSPDTHIVGGTAASANEWPWQGGWLSGGSFSCGCSVVHANWIITAGHCVGGPVGTYSVELGNINRGQGTVIDVTSVVRHPEYNQGAGFTPNDVAVVGASVPINGGSIIAVPGGIDDGENRESQTCYITGWGRTCGNCALPVVLQEANTPVITPELCRSEHGVSYQEANMICVFDQVNQDTGACNGDSGGPLVCQGSSGTWDLVGATSWGTTGCPTTNPSVYARLSAFRAWICDETAGAVAC